MRSKSVQRRRLARRLGPMRVYHPGFGTSVPVDRSFLSDDPDTAVAQTIARMAQYVREDSDSEQIKRLAGQLRGASVQDSVMRVWNWIRMRVRFVSDREIASAFDTSPSIAEVLIRPVDLIRMQDAQEDCDGFSMLGAAIFLTLGIPVQFVTVAADPNSPDQFSHVYLWVNGAAFDSSHGPFLGWEARNRFGKRQLWSVQNGMPMMRSAGLRGLGEDPAPLDFGFVTGSDPAPGSNSNFFQTLVAQGVNAATSILKARYAIPPPGTLITTPGGTIATAGAPGTSTGLITSTAAFSSGIPSWVWIAGAGLVLVLVLKRK